MFAAPEREQALPMMQRVLRADMNHIDLVGFDQLLIAAEGFDRAMAAREVLGPARAAAGHAGQLHTWQTPQRIGVLGRDPTSPKDAGSDCHAVAFVSGRSRRRAISDLR